MEVVYKGRGYTIDYEPPKTPKLETAQDLAQFIDDVYDSAYKYLGVYVSCDDDGYTWNSIKDYLVKCGINFINKIPTEEQIKVKEAEIRKARAQEKREEAKLKKKKIEDIKRFLSDLNNCEAYKKLSEELQDSIDSYLEDLIYEDN